MTREGGGGGVGFAVSRDGVRDGVGGREGGSGGVRFAVSGKVKRAWSLAFAKTGAGSRQWKMTKNEASVVSQLKRKEASVVS